MDYEYCLGVGEIRRKSLKYVIILYVKSMSGLFNNISHAHTHGGRITDIMLMWSNSFSLSAHLCGGRQVKNRKWKCFIAVSC